MKIIALGISLFLNILLPCSLYHNRFLTKIKFDPFCFDCKQCLIGFPYVQSLEINTFLHTNKIIDDDFKKIMD